MSCQSCMGCQDKETYYIQIEEMYHPLRCSEIKRLYADWQIPDYMLTIKSEIYTPAFTSHTIRKIVQGCTGGRQLTMVSFFSKMY